MIPGGVIGIWMAIGYVGWQWFRRTEQAPQLAATDNTGLRRHWLLKPSVAAAFFLLPFIASTYSRAAINPTCHPRKPPTPRSRPMPSTYAFPGNQRTSASSGSTLQETGAIIP